MYSFSAPSQQLLPQVDLLNSITVDIATLLPSWRDIWSIRCFIVCRCQFQSFRRLCFTQNGTIL